MYFFFFFGVLFWPLFPSFTSFCFFPPYFFFPFEISEALKISWCLLLYYPQCFFFLVCPQKKGDGISRPLQCLWGQSGAENVPHKYTIIPPIIPQLFPNYSPIVPQLFPKLLDYMNSQFPQFSLFLSPYF